MPPINVSEAREGAVLSADRVAEHLGSLLQLIGQRGYVSLGGGKQVEVYQTQGCITFFLYEEQIRSMSEPCHPKQKNKVLSSFFAKSRLQYELCSLSIKASVLNVIEPFTFFFLFPLFWTS